jgi:hypothetical protein
VWTYSHQLEEPLRYFEPRYTTRRRGFVNRVRGTTKTFKISDIPTTLPTGVSSEMVVIESQGRPEEVAVTFGEEKLKKNVAWLVFRQAS